MSTRNIYLWPVGIAILSILIQTNIEMLESLQWSRSEPLAMYSWITSHLCHWSWDHLWWDLLAFGSLSAVAIRLAGHRYFWCLGLSALAICFEFHLFQTDLSTYRGLSGIDSAIFGLITYQLFKVGGKARLMSVIAASAFSIKTGVEIISGNTVFVNAEQAFTPVPSAHLVGFASGILSGIKVHFGFSDRKFVNIH